MDGDGCNELRADGIICRSTPSAYCGITITITIDYFSFITVDYVVYSITNSMMMIIMNRYIDDDEDDELSDRLNLE